MKGAFLIVLLAVGLRCTYGDAPTSQPTFVSSEGVVWAKEHETAVLPCRVQNMVTDVAMTWKRISADSDMLIYTQDFRMTDDERFELVQEPAGTYDLHINEVDGYDTGQYVCSLTTTPVINQMHELQVYVAPTVSVDPSKVYSAKPGATVSLKCFASGNPNPSVIWKRVSYALPDGRMQSEGAALHITNFSHSTEGTYECTADNGMGSSKATVQLVLESDLNGTPVAPWVEGSDDYLPAKLHDSVNMSCRYGGNPKPDKLTWWFGGFLLKHNEQPDKFTIFQSADRDGQTQILQVKNVTLGDFGEYMCRVQNSKGSAQKSIYMTDSPGPVDILDYKAGATSVLLKWRVESAESIAYFKIDYRKRHEETWMTKNSTTAAQKVTDADTTFLWECTDMLEGLEKNTTYEVRVVAINRNLKEGVHQRVYKEVTTEYIVPPKINPTSKTREPGASKGADALRHPWLLAVVVTVLTSVLAQSS